MIKEILAFNKDKLKVKIFKINDEMASAGAVFVASRLNEAIKKM